MRRVLLLLAAVVLIGVVVIGLTQAGGPGAQGDAARFDLQAAKRQLAGAPAPLAALHAQSNQLIDGGKPAFDKQLAALKGHPVVITKWASWCGPCQVEFPIFESVSTKRGKEVAFLGLNAQDENPSARRFLADRPLPFPSYTDPNEDISRALEAPKNLPMTIFIDRAGKTHTHAGQYNSDAELNADIDRYAN
jgi:cytochrome c biogenesis protein CcmG/thiol:disulfide interchange protein DsbE